MPDSPTEAGGVCDLYHIYSLFLRLTTALNGRIPVVPQPRIEGRGSSQGASATLHSPIHGMEFPNGRIIRAGNKFGRQQVFEVNWNWGYLCVKRIPEDRAKASQFAGRTALHLNESFRLTCRLNRTESSATLMRATICGDSKNVRLAHNRRKRFPLELMIFTAGNPPEGQQ